MSIRVQTFPELVDEPLYVMWPARVFLVLRIGIPLFIIGFILLHKGKTKHKTLISLILFIVLGLTFYLEYGLYGDINILRLFSSNEMPDYVFPEFT